MHIPAIFGAGIFWILHCFIISSCLCSIKLARAVIESTSDNGEKCQLDFWKLLHFVAMCCNWLLSNLFASAHTARVIVHII